MSRALAVNHAGWNVEVLSPAGEGWVALDEPFDSKESADYHCNKLRKVMPDAEFRVYEALK